MRKRRNIKIALIINLLISIMTVFASVSMYTGFKFMSGAEPVLEVTSISMLRFFTVQSNLFMGIIALVFAIKYIKLLNNKIENISKKWYIIKLMSTTAVAFTCIAVFVYLGPISKGGLMSLLRNSNLFFHLLIPVISIMNFIAFEKVDNIEFKSIILSLVPIILYGLYYFINIVTHIENGTVSSQYDWYRLVQNGLWTAIFIFPLVLGVAYMISFVLWKLNKKGANTK